MNLELLDYNEPEKGPTPKAKQDTFSPIRFALSAFFGMIVLWFSIGLVVVVQIDSENSSSTLGAILGLILPSLMVYMLLFSVAFGPVLRRRLAYSIWISIFWLVPPPFLISLAFLNARGDFAPSTTELQVIGTLVVGLAISTLLGTAMFTLGKAMGSNTAS